MSRAAPVRSSGFTLIELVVAIAIGSVVVVFVAMFLTAPLGAYEAQSRRIELVGSASTAWPRMEQDLRRALPNSVRSRVNGNYRAIEMMSVMGVTRYGSAANVNSVSFAAGGSPGGVFKDLPANPPPNSVSAYLSVNPNANVYALSGSITNTRRTVNWTTNAVGVGNVGLNTAPAFTSLPSPRRRLYLVSGAVTYLCDLTQGTLRRYGGYTIATAQTSCDAPNEFGTATSNDLIASGITACDFTQSAASATQPQTVAVRLTATQNGESVTLLHQTRAEYLP